MDKETKDLKGRVRLSPIDAKKKSRSKPHKVGYLLTVPTLLVPSSLTLLAVSEAVDAPQAFNNLTQALGWPPGPPGSIGC